MGAESAMILGALGGMAMSAMQKPPKMPEAQPAPEAPQASKAPDTATVMSQMQGQGQAGGAPGIGSTFLTGAGGIDQKSVPVLRKQTLLG